jgi:PQQ-dependent dehydrogenase (methanol/ethanol family)
MRRVWTAIALGLALGVSACGQPAAKGAGAVDASRLIAADKEPGQWMSPGRTYDEQRHSPLTKINTETVGKLGLAWFAEFDTDRGQQATPVVIDGTLYTTTAWSKVFAFDAKTGDLKWSYDPQVPGEAGFNACCDVVNRGVAVWNGVVYAGTIDGRLIALDAATGALKWQQITVDQAQPYTITMAPRVVKGKVIIGNGGGEYGVRGYVSAYDAESGNLAWRFYTTPNPKGEADGAASDKIFAEKAAATWFGEGWKESGGGGTVWDSLAYDPKLDILYVGVGNGSPWNHQLRSDGKGDNLFLSSILALKPETGEYVWHYQTTPGDTWDYTATQHMILADVTIDGKARQVIMQAPKNGFFYVLDRANGELISAKPYIPMMPEAVTPPGAPISWSTGEVDMKTGRPIENPSARYNKGEPVLVFPAPYGGHNWHPMSFNPKDGLVYIPVLAPPMLGPDGNPLPIGALAQPFLTDPMKRRPGAWNTNASFMIEGLPDDRAARAGLRAMLRGQLLAWDPIKQEARWSVSLPSFWNGGVLSTAGGLVFQGTAEGELVAYNAASGEKLWSTNTTNGIIAAPSTYEIAGEQYLAVMVGYGGAAPLAASALLPQRPKLPGRLMVYKIGGTATAPAYEIPEALPIDLTGVTTKGNAKAGFAHYQSNCLVCHGEKASGVYLPDLKRSPILRDAESFKAVVIDGAKASTGMASFSRFLNEKEAEDIRAYILDEARKQQRVDAASAGK